MKVADFGLARSLTQLRAVEGQNPILTDYVATRWYHCIVSGTPGLLLILFDEGTEPLKSSSVLLNIRSVLTFGQVVAFLANYLMGIHNFLVTKYSRLIRFQKATFSRNFYLESTRQDHGGKNTITYRVMNDRRLFIDHWETNTGGSRCYEVPFCIHHARVPAIHAKKGN